MFILFLSASPLGTMMKNRYGYITLYSFTLSLVTLTLIYSFFLKDSIYLVSEEKEAAMLKERDSSSTVNERQQDVVDFNYYYYQKLETRNFRTVCQHPSPRQTLFLLFLLVLILKTMVMSKSQISFFSPRTVLELHGF